MTLRPGCAPARLLIPNSEPAKLLLSLLARESHPESREPSSYYEYPLKRLEALGFITVTSVPERAWKRMTLTPAGQEAAQVLEGGGR